MESGSFSRSLPDGHRLRPVISWVRHLYGFEWLALASLVATAVFFITSPVSTQFLRLATMTFSSCAKIAAISIALILAIKISPVIRHRSSLKEAVGSSELASPRFWTDVVRIIVSFSLVQTSHLILKLYIPVINPANNDHLLHQLDRALLLGHDPVALVKGLFTSPFSLRIMDAAYSGFYFFLLWGGVVLFFAVLTGRTRIAFFNSYLLMWQLGLLLYVLFPSWGPVFVRPQEFLPTLQNLPATVHIQSALYEETRSIVAGNYNLVVHYFGLAAFPSLHVAVFVLYSLWARFVGRAWLWWNLACLGIIFLGSMLTGYHYFVDGVGGGLMAALCYMVVRNQRNQEFNSGPPHQDSAIIVS